VSERLTNHKEQTSNPWSCLFTLEFITMKKLKFFSLTLMIFIVLSGFTLYAYSNQLSFTANPSVSPAVIAALGDYSCTSVYIAFDITDDGGNQVIKKGVCWGTSLNPTTANYIGYNDD
jgi:hypothetical protein